MMVSQYRSLSLRSSTDVRVCLCQDKDGDTPLHNAVKGGREEAVKRLLELGADAELANEKGNAPGESNLNS